tara:strand:+ start:194 stop:946 length:753 start_codon:yes stop_codon:yes gene_type:complete
LLLAPRSAGSESERYDELTESRGTSRISNRCEWPETFERIQVSSFDGDGTIAAEVRDKKGAILGPRVGGTQTEGEGQSLSRPLVVPRPDMVDSECQTEHAAEEMSLCVQSEPFMASPVRKMPEIAAACSPRMWASLSESDAVWLEGAGAYVPSRRSGTDHEVMNMSALDTTGMDFPPGLGATPSSKKLQSSAVPSICDGTEHASEDLSVSTPVAVREKEPSVSMMRLDSLQERDRSIRTLNFMAMTEAPN